ncbi:hypothetical protein Lesp02_06400 [Lentzea sp. NBRC 105346]|uniref:hypothetical protein n=1 Tax=Lentzea sp. NBRC 105346 TaxID=3032205 RepID=UPI0024A3FC47|nr:hypothetical protein [Lentzea sp. NBRC 105346]GLZ28450.1 hypothetical protein Lesp02_06400 [Lentzea sp. NBRC 105346]
MRRWLLAGTVVVVALGAIGLGLLPTTEDGFRSTAVTSARDTRSAVLSTREVGAAALRGRVLQSYVNIAVQRARDQVSTAITDLVDTEVPGPSSQRLRDEVLPMLTRSAARINDVATASSTEDRDALSRAVDELSGLAGELGGVR